MKNFVKIAGLALLVAAMSPSLAEARGYNTSNSVLGDTTMKRNWDEQCRHWHKDHVWKNAEQPQSAYESERVDPVDGKIIRDGSNVPMRRTHYRNR